jgi:hypothetical protein
VLLSSDPMRFRALESAACAITAGILIFRRVKRGLRRTRPRDIEPHCWAQVTTRDRFSFPSGPSTTAFAVALSLWVLLSGDRAGANRSGGERGDLARRPGNAFLERRHCGLGHGRTTRVRVFPFTLFQVSRHIRDEQIVMNPGPPQASHSYRGWLQPTTGQRYRLRLAAGPVARTTYSASIGYEPTAIA